MGRGGRVLSPARYIATPVWARYHELVIWNFSAIRAKTYAFVPEAEGTIPTIKLTGTGDAEAMPPLDRFLKLVHKDLVDDRRGAVAVDLTSLYFINSSCLKAFVSWIHKVKTDRSYQIRLQMNPRLSWQRRSLEPLKRLAPKVVLLEEVDPREPEPARPMGR